MLPKELGRPEYCEISEEAIRAVGPELGATDITYIREYLEVLGPEYEPPVVLVPTFSLNFTLL
jgi:hypothetical protein